MTRGTLLLLSFPFALGVFCLAFAFAITLSRSGGNNPADSLPQVFIWFSLAGLAFAIAQLGFVGVIHTARTRWLAFLLIAVLLLGFSALAIFSFGILTAPVGLILLGLSGYKLWRHSQR